MSIPLQSNLDPDKPDEHALWALVNMGANAGAPLILPEPVLRSWSEHLWRCGFRHQPELQEIDYHPPAEDASVLEAGAGRWVSRGGDDGGE